MQEMPPKGPQGQSEAPEAVAERIMMDLAQLEQMAADAGVDPKGISEVSAHFAQVIEAFQGGAEKPAPGGPTQGGPGAVPAM